MVNLRQVVLCTTRKLSNKNLPSPSISIPTKSPLPIYSMSWLNVRCPLQLFFLTGAFFLFNLTGI